MIFVFEQFELDTGQWELRADGAPVTIEPKGFELLAFLVEHRDRILSRDEILDHVWPDVFVSDASLSTAIKQIRKALGDTGQDQKFIKTVRGRGFRFVAEAGLKTHAVPAPSPATAAPAKRPDLLGPPVLAVLPFDLLGTETTHSAIADALPTELIATFSQLKWVKVIARASAFQFRAPNYSVEDIRDKLGAAYILSGAIELAGSRLAIFAELVDARNQTVVWSEAFNAPIEEIFELRTRIAREVATVVEYRLAINETTRLNHVPSENLDAWGHYHRGIRAMFHYNQSDNETAGEHFARAARIDPNFARAHAALSYTEFQNYFQQFGTAFDYHRQLAMEHAENAVRLDPLDPYCNLMLGRAKWIGGEIDEGLACVNRSLTLAPNYAFGFYNSALLSTILCDGEHGETHVAAALARSPVDPHKQTMLGTRALAAFVRDDDAQALSYSEQAMKTTNAHVHVYLLSAGIQAAYGHEDKAQRGLQEARRRNVTLDGSGLRKHFDLRDTRHHQRLFGALEKLGA